MGIEPTSSAWEAEVLPLNNTRRAGTCLNATEQDSISFPGPVNHGVGAGPASDPRRGVPPRARTPIESGFGVCNPYNLLTIIENASVPILVDAGVGTASDAAIAMELGCHGVPMNTAIAAARDPTRMASAMRKAVEAGREAFLAGRMPRRRYACASSPLDGTFV